MCDHRYPWCDHRRETQTGTHVGAPPPVLPQRWYEGARARGVDRWPQQACQPNRARGTRPVQRWLRGSGPHRPTRAVSADSDAGIAPAMELYDNCLQHTARTSSTHTALRRRCFRSDGTQAERAHGRGSMAARMPAANARVTGSVQTPLWGGGPHKPVRAVSAESDAGIVPPMALYENDLQHTTRAVSDCSAPQSPARPGPRAALHRRCGAPAAMERCRVPGAHMYVIFALHASRSNVSGSVPPRLL